MKYTILDFIRFQRAPVLPVTTGDLTGKTVVVIGANGGIGIEASKHFAQMNPGKLILGCRSRERGEAALKDLEKDTGYKRAEVWSIDLASFASVTAFAERFEKEESRLDLLVLNAAVILTGEDMENTTSDGWRTELQANDISPELLALLLLPIMIRTGTEHQSTPRLVVVSSSVTYWTKFPKELVERPNFFTEFNEDVYWHSAVSSNTRYADTKLLNLLFVRALNDRLGLKPVIINAVCPGYCYSNLRTGYQGLASVVDKVLEYFLAHTSEEGSRELVWASVGRPESEEMLRGAFVSMSKVQEPSDWVLSDDGKAAQEKIWGDLIVVLGKVSPKVNEIVEQYLTIR